MALTFWLWGKQQGRIGGAVGEVQFERRTLTAPDDGPIIALDRQPWRLFELVESGQLIAQLDEAPIEAQLGVVRKEVERLEAELAATKQTILLEYYDLAHEHERELLRLSPEIWRLKLDALDRTVEIETDMIALKRLDAQLAFYDQHRGTRSVNPVAVEDVRLQREEIQKRIDMNAAAKKEVEALAASAQEEHDSYRVRYADYPSKKWAAAATLLAPLDKAIEKQNAIMQQLQVQKEGLKIVAPINATIIEILTWPGQSVRQGDPIMTIASNHARHIVSYIRPEQGIQPHVDMEVTVRSRTPGSQPLDTKIEEVGPQTEPIPPHHLSDPTQPEWGRPVLIGIPSGLDVHPGELLDITFKPNSKRSG